MKRLSIIIPVYNLENYIEKTIRLCEEQDIEKCEYEIICINDGSSDKSLDVLNSLCSEYPNIVVCSQENGGVSEARNKGLELAQGRYIWFVDGDDLPSRNVLKNALEFVEKNDIDILGFRMENTCARAPAKTVWEMPCICCDEDTYSFMLTKGGAGSGVWSQWYKREIIINNNIRFNKKIKYSEDVLFSFVVLMHCTRCAKTESVLYAYYQREGSAMHSANYTEHLASMHLLAKEYERLAKEHAEWVDILKSKQFFAVKAMLFSLVQEGNVKLAKEKIKLLREEGLYPFPFLTESLKNNQTKKQAIINYSSFLFPIKAYFMLMVRLVSFKKKMKK